MTAACCWRGLGHKSKETRVLYTTYKITFWGALICKLQGAMVTVYNIKERNQSQGINIRKKFMLFDLTMPLRWHFLTWARAATMACIISPSSFFSTTFWWFKQHGAIGHSCEQMPPRSLYVLPFRLYCQPAYPALMELLKSRYEQNLGGPAFVRACVPIRWEHDDKNLSNACRSCHSMHNNLRLCGWKKNTLRQERKGCFGDEYV